MGIFGHGKIELLVSQRRFSEAATVLGAFTASDDSERAQRRRLLDALHAIAGNERALANGADPQLIACRTAADVAAYQAISGGGVYEDLAAGVILTWSSRGTEACDAFRRAYDSATENQVPFAVASLERLAYHALLFGDIEGARSALAEALALASKHQFSRWLLHCLIGCAQLAVDTGDAKGAAELFERATAQASSPPLLALCAPVGAQIAVEREDTAALRLWTGPEIVKMALFSDDREAATAATIALLIGTGTQTADPNVLIALRRALLGMESAHDRPDLFSLGARYGAADEARLAMRALAAGVAPNRSYLKAHRILARAHLSFRYGAKTSWTDHASDAARAFNAMGLRRWTNEAMMLLVRQGGAAGRQGRDRPGNVMLTEREQQVADLIRRGARNREVALTLQISENTVERHVSSILGRLGLKSRWQIADMQKTGDG